MIIRLVSSVIIGAIFGLGIAISGMANPAKVLNFFDVAGTWDPSLIFVMGGAVLTAGIGYLLLFRARQKPVIGHQFHVPTNKTIDKRLIGGSAIFGIGWGIAGFCPGGAIPALGLGYQETIIFVASLIVGVALAKTIINRPAVFSRA